MIRAATLSLALAATPGLAGADGFCADLAQLFDAGTAPPGFGDCAQSIAIGGVVSIQCRREFPFRAPEARTDLDAVDASLRACTGVQFLATDDPVNHPDSYDLRLFQTPQGQVALSLKDKGALQQTILFLRVTPE